MFGVCYLELLTHKERFGGEASGIICIKVKYPTLTSFIYSFHTYNSLSATRKFPKWFCFAFSIQLLSFFFSFLNTYENLRFVSITNTSVYTESYHAETSLWTSISNEISSALKTVFVSYQALERYSAARGNVGDYVIL